VGVLLVISAILRSLIGIYIIFLWARFIIDWIRVLNPRFTPKRGLSVIFELVYTLTDPPIKMFRKIIPPLRLGTFSLDFGWLLTLISCLLIQGFLP